MESGGEEEDEGLIANSGSRKIGNGWVEAKDLIEQVKGL